MKILFTNIDEVREFITVDISSDLATIKPYIFQAENKYIKELIGASLLDQLRTHVETQGTNADLDILLEIVRFPAIHYAYRLGSDRLNISISDRGMTVLNSSSEVPASSDRVDKLKNELENAAGDGAEDLLGFLEDNDALYPDWKLSNAYSFQRKYFVNNATDIKTFTGDEFRRIDFIRYKADLNLFEQTEIESTTCSALFERLKQSILDQDYTPEEFLLINKYIKPACCYHILELQKKTKERKFENRAVNLVNQLRIYLNDNVGDYPLFASSSCYDAGLTPIFTIDQNDTDSPIFIL